MLKRIFLLALLMLVLITASLVSAQATTPSAPQVTQAAPQSTVTFNLVLCDNRAVVSFNGVMQAGYDVYYQVFNAGNQALTGQRQVSVSGNYNFTEVIGYNPNTTVAAGGSGYMTVTIAREGSPSSTIYTSRANDVNDGCTQPESAIGTSSTGSSGSENAVTDPTTGQPLRANSILSPFGGFLNPDYVPTPKPLVVIGAANVLPPRQQTAGLVFAECNDYPVANPGLIYDTDNVTVFWSWFARTPELVQQHIDNAQYEVGYFGSVPFIPKVEISEIQKRTNNYWVFYTIPLGNVKPGYYTVSFKLTWKNTISDGFDEFGPNTENDVFFSGCDFEVRANPNGTPVKYTFP